MRINISPEFYRNSWLELNRHRLIVTPLILFSVFFLIYLWFGNSSETFLKAFYYTGVFFYLGFTLIMGTKSAGESISNEIGEGTWDSQRMTSISPWAMTWGKLFGSTIYGWYGGIIALCFGVVGAVNLPGIDVIGTVVLLIGASVLSHAIAMLFNLSLIARTRSIKRNRSTYVFHTLLMLFAIAYVLYGEENGTLIWYGAVFNTYNFTVLSVVTFCIWSILGVYRLIREELNYRNSSIVWLLFTSFTSIFCAGFINIANIQFESDLYAMRLVIAITIFMCGGYLILFIQKKDPILLSRIGVLRNQRKWLKILQTLPAWSTTFLTGNLLFIALFFFSVTSSNSLNYLFDNKLLLVSILLFIYRDILIVIYYSMDPSAKNIETRAMVLLLILYLLLPVLLNTLGLHILASLFHPFANQPSSISFISSLIQFSAMGYLIYRRNLTNRNLTFQ